ncbi:MAG: class I SAM-dependent methyltransferase [Chloroflexota bacterium]|nr:class I SAM-dependent methyltransferase [Chloroflexota bacterium]
MSFEPTYGILPCMTHQAQPRERKPPTYADYGNNYFVTLYGEAPQQTLIDRGRDWLIRRLVAKYASGGRLLEIGCGFGYLLSSFSRAAPAQWQLHGTDISAHAAAVAQRRLPHAAIVAADIQQGIPFSGQFDALIAVNVLEHLPAPATAANAIAAAIRPGGIVVAHLPTISSQLSGWIYARTYESDPTHVYRPSGEAFNQLFAQAGFRMLEARYCPFWPAALWNWLKPHPAYLAVFERL